MGYRLHFAKVHKVEWEGGYFTGSELDKVADMFNSEIGSFWQDEGSDIWEINKDELRAYIKKLKTLKPKTINKYFEAEDGYTNQDMVEILSDILDNSEPDEDYIRIEWF